MEKLIVRGRTPLKGAVRLGGAKNASSKLIIASLLSNSDITLLNASDIGDVMIVADIIRSLGGKIERRGSRTFYISPSKVSSYKIPDQYGEVSRASIMFAGPLLAKFGKAYIPYPGGDKIGKRPLERHFGALQSLGAEIFEREDGVELSCKRLIGSTIRFPKNTHTGTENAIIAAVLAEGKTVIENAALEPEIDDLIAFLNKAGAKIRRKSGRVIEIEGVKFLGSATHKIMPDRNEAVTYACAAIGTEGDIILEDANPNHLQAFLEKLGEIGAGYQIDTYGIRFFYKGRLHATDMTTEIHPGFMTDWQPLWVSLALKCRGVSTIVESIFENRFGFAEILKNAGADISFFNPKPENPDEFYNFNYDPEGDHSRHGMRVVGKKDLQPIKTEIKDLRFGAMLLIATMMIDGESEFWNIDQLDRGYENLDGKLRELGADITRIEK